MHNVNDIPEFCSAQLYMVTQGTGRDDEMEVREVRVVMECLGVTGLLETENNIFLFIFMIKT